ncbi:MAG: mandelate racemase/muconate lactonizing enzyme family protein [Acidobacteria bacterium]|nr:mandelate racemase/muconate lactonizing enzyme family protein [Acidobacteriota bacterium]
MNRRDFFSTATATGAAPFLQAAAGAKPAIKITDIKTFLLGIGNRNLLFVKVETDQGFHGIGEAYSCGPDEATLACINDFKSWLLGQDPRNIEHLWTMMYNFTRFPGGLVVNAAISGIEHALWDISGKAAGLPVYMLLGGKCREKVRVYQSIRDSETAVRLREKYGYTAFKTQPPGMNANPYNRVTREGAEHLRKLREALGPDVDIGVDVHAQFFELSRAWRMARVLEPYNPMWLEEPIRPENASAMRKLADRVTVPLASGECNYTRHEFQEILSAQALDIVQPDICLCGGMLEMKKIAAMAAANYVVVAPHNPMGPLATVVNTHFAASTHNFFILEYHPDDVAPRKDLLKETTVARDGYLPVPTKPGWGVELNEEAFRHYPPKPWHRSFVYRTDGSVAYI